MRDLVLTGFMGTGKTTVGKILAARLGRSFVDTDEEIERLAGMPIARIFSEQGEEAFRRLEQEVVSGLGSHDGRVIATGGGVLMSRGNRDVLSSSEVVCLVADPATIEERLSHSDCRPLLQTPGDLYRLLEQRQPVYDLFPQVQTTERRPQEVADEVARVAGLPVYQLAFPGRDTSTVVVEEGVLDRVGSMVGELAPDSQVFLLADENLETLGWRARLSDSLRGAGVPASCTVIPAGEAQKSPERLDDLYADCVQAGIGRTDTIIGLGGGVVGDLSGMLAATYMRGVRLILIPTTLLAQVDASVGGKVGIDAHGVKNLLGAFHPARLVAIDPLVLSTLPVQALSDGMAEIVKMGLMLSRPLVRDLERMDRLEDILDTPDITWAAARVKADVVCSDPYENGQRALLNFGHTVGHGLEAAGSYAESHGRCVAAGMWAECRVSVESGETNPRVSDVLGDLLQKFRLPHVLAGIDRTRAWEAARHDKKRSGEVARVAIPADVGAGQVVSWTNSMLERALALAVGSEG